MWRKDPIKRQFEVGYVSSDIEIVRKHDQTNAENPVDATYFYDVLDHKTNRSYVHLTYREVEKVINGESVKQHLVYFIDQKMIDKMRYQYLPTNDNEVAIIENSLMKPSELEQGLIKLVQDCIMDEEDKIDDENEMYLMALGELDYILENSDRMLDEDAKKFLAELDGSIKQKSPHKYYVGEIIKGRYTSFEIIFKYDYTDDFRRAIYDIKDLRTGKIYFKRTARDIKRMAQSDFPIITVDGTSLRLLDWANVLNMSNDSMRNSWRKCGEDEEKMARLIKGHLNNIKEGKNKYDGTFNRDRKD